MAELFQSQWEFRGQFGGMKCAGSSSLRLDEEWVREGRTLMLQTQTSVYGSLDNVACVWDKSRLKIQMKKQQRVCQK